MRNKASSDLSLMNWSRRGKQSPLPKKSFQSLRRAYDLLILEIIWEAELAVSSSCVLFGHRPESPTSFPCLRVEQCVGWIMAFSTCCATAVLRARPRSSSKRMGFICSVSSFNLHGMTFHCCGMSLTQESMQSKQNLRPWDFALE